MSGRQRLRHLARARNAPAAVERDSHPKADVPALEGELNPTEMDFGLEGFNPLGAFEKLDAECQLDVFCWYNECVGGGADPLGNGMGRMLGTGLGGFTHGDDTPGNPRELISKCDESFIKGGGGH